MPMKDSKINDAWLQEQMAKNPPSLRPNGNLFSGPVRLAFVNLFKPGKPSQDGNEGKFGAAILFPPGTNMTLFEQHWLAAARQHFPNNFDPQGKPIGLHSPFHDQAEKAFGAKPLAGYTPGAFTFSATSKFKPAIVDPNQNLIVDEARVYPGVWAFVAFNLYHYGVSPPRPKKGIAFGMQTVMIIADDTKLAGTGGDPTKDFAGVQITAQTNMAAAFDGAPSAGQAQTGGSGLMPSGGHVGTMGNLPTQPLPAGGDDLSSLM